MCIKIKCSCTALFLVVLCVCMCVLQGVPVSAQSCRHVSLHEHHSMDLMSTYGISVPRGELATTAEQARDITQRLGMHVHVHM